MKFLLAVIYGSPRRHSDSSKASKKNLYDQVVIVVGCQLDKNGKKARDEIEGKSGRVYRGR